MPAWLSWPLRLAVLAGLASYILHGLDFAEVGDSLIGIPLRIFVYALLIQACGQCLVAIRWKLLLHEPSVRFLDCLAYIGLGTSLTLVSPSGLLADGLISYWMGKRSRKVIKTLSALWASRLIGVGSMTLFFLLALPGHLWVFRNLDFTWAPGKVLFAILALAVLAAAAFTARRQKRRLSDLLDQALPALRAPKALAGALALSVGIHSCQFLILYLGIRAMDIPIGLADILFFAPVITFIGMVPISIGGMGVRETLGIFFYTLLPGVQKEQILAHAAYGYLVLILMAGVNLALAFAVLGKSEPVSTGKRDSP